MDLTKILAAVDHTLLAQGATWEQIKGICDDGMKYHTASVCIPASYAAQAKAYVGTSLPSARSSASPTATPPPPPSALKPPMR